MTPLKRGRPPLISNNGKVRLTDILSKSNDEVKGLTIEEFESAFYYIIREEHDLNQDVARECCRKSLYNYRKEYNLVEDHSDGKTPSGIEAFKNIRTPITLCCMLNTIQSLVHPANFHSVDDVSVLVDSMTNKVKVNNCKNGSSFI